MTTALIIDDEPDIRELLSLSLGRMGYDCHVAANLEQATNLVQSYDFDVCLTDMRLPDGNGLDFVKFLQSEKPELPVAVITAHGNMDAAVEAMKNGAFDFVSKPVDLQKLRNLVTSAVGDTDKNAANQGTASAPTNRSASVANKSSLDSLIGSSRAIVDLKAVILKLGHSNAPVWITGESGTGKELTAQLIHTNSARRNHLFVPINCGAIPTELMESELFGHKKGSFTGAHSDYQGLFSKADGGTLFLDEVAELPLHMQVKLLRVIQEKSVRAIGESSEKPVDVRILSATHKNLEHEVEAGRFRHDLYYRLNVIKVRCPALHERRADIPILSRHLLQKICAANHSDSLTLSEEGLAKLCQYRFPGNVRELENVLERAAALCEGTEIMPEDLDLSENHEPAAERRSLRQVSTGRDESNSEKAEIIQALENTRWNRKAAAELLNLSYRQLRYRIKQYNIDSDDE